MKLRKFVAQYMDESLDPNVFNDRTERLSLKKLRKLEDELTEILEYVRADRERKEAKKLSYNYNAANYLALRSAVTRESLGCDHCDDALSDFLTNGPGKLSERPTFKVSE